MYLKIMPSKLSGLVRVPASKSLMHRAILAALLCNGKSVLKNVDLSTDVLATLEAVRVLGAKYKFSGRCLTIWGNFKGLQGIERTKTITIDCFNSASTLRFLVPLVAAFKIRTKFLANGQLIKRIRRCNELFFLKIFKKCVKVNEILKPGVFYFKKCLTSQYITGLLLVLPVLKKRSFIFFDSEIESKSYINLTVSFLKKLNIRIKPLKRNGFEIEGGQVYKPFSYYVEGDYSQSAFFAVAGCLSKIKLKNLNFKSKQGDLKILQILKFCGAKIRFYKQILVIEPGKKNLKSFNVNLKNNLDLVPVLAVMASMCNGKTNLSGLCRLVFKESNRIISVVNLISNLGGKIELKKNSLQVEGVDGFKGGVVDCHFDHRIAMAAAIASLFCKEPVILKNFECVCKSYPKFFMDFKKLGGVCNVINLE